MATTTVQAPVKGMVFKHARRKDYNDEPLTCEVTSVGPDKVFWVHPLYRDKRFKTPLALWDKMVLEVVSVPQAQAKAESPKFTDAQALALWDRAHAAGLAAGEAVQPVPMVVIERKHQMGDLLGMSPEDNPVVRADVVPSGVCGFGYVYVRPANSSFARWMKKTRRGSVDSYKGGLFFSVREFGQSLECKQAFAHAFAAVLRESGINAFAESRMD